VATINASKATGFNAIVTAYQAGGDGGGGENGADGGAGAASTMTNMVSATSRGGYINLRHQAAGGTGGYSATKVGGDGGAATSSLTFDDVATNVITAAAGLYAGSSAYGGNGNRGLVAGGKGGAGKADVNAHGAGRTNGYATARGGHGGNIGYGGAASGAAGGTATANAKASSTSSTETALARASAFGGNGGSGHGAGKNGGVGGTATGSTATAQGRNASAYVNQIGGHGGAGGYGANGGTGASVTTTDAVSGSTTGGTLRLRQDSSGGRGGNANSGSGNGGAGGAATSKATFNDETANAIDAMRFYGIVHSYGGGGGNGAAAGKAGAATGGVYVTGVNYVHATAIARGGRSGTVGGVYGAIGGSGDAVSHATATGAGAYSRAVALAASYGGRGTTDGGANSLAKATTAAGQLANARASGSGAGGNAESISVTATKGLVTKVETSANAQVGSSASTETQAFAAGSLSSFDNDNAYNFALSLPALGFISSALTSNSAVNTALGGPLATVFAAGMGGNNYASDATGNRSYKGTTTWSINTTTLTGNLILGLLDSNVLGAGFQSLSFTVAIEGVTVLTKAFTSAQVANAATYFDNNAVNLGVVANDADLQVALTYSIVGNAVGTGFGMSYVLGTTNDGVDTTPPPAPSTPDLMAFADSGASDTDNLTNITAPTFTGTAEANSLVELFSGATKIGSVKADGTGGWTITSNPLGEGAHSITAKATDAAGNVSAASGALSVTIDTTPPNAASTPDLDAASDSGSSNTDNITNDNTPTFVGTADAGLLVTILLNGGFYVSGVADGAGKYALTHGFSVGDGVYTITSMTTDAAGNTKLGAGSLSLTIDTVAPPAPTDLDLATSSDKGSSNTDNITNIKTPTFTGKGTLDTTITVFSGATSVGSAAVKADGTWLITTSSLADGVQSITAKATDVAGNVSVASTALSVTIDTVAPAAPTLLDLLASSDSGASNTDNNTNDNTPTISGKAEVGSTVAIFSTGVQVGQAKANASGVWAITTSALADGTHALRARATDVAGNTGVLSSALSVVIDTKAPATSAAPDLAAASDSGASNSDDITNDNTATITGVTEANASVDIFDGATKLTTLKADATGNWSFTTAALADGAHAITTVSTDLAGNVSAKSPALNLLIDTLAPAVPVISVANPSLVSGTAEAGATVELFNNAASIGTTTADGAGAWSFTAPVAEGQHLLSAKATDKAGNTSASSATRRLEIGTDSDDVLGTPGANTYFGLLGNDIYFVDNMLDSVIENPGGGIDTVYAGVGYALAVDSEIEFLIAATGDGLALTGNGNNNSIFGGAGNDTITGGGGRDLLVGGPGADVFKYVALADSTTAPAGRDTIADFSQTFGDRIGLSDLDADTITAGDQAFTFIGTGPFTSVAGQLRIQIGATSTIVSGDTNGDGTADFQIRLRGAITLTAADFQL
jgi:hypothetical protein